MQTKRSVSACSVCPWTIMLLAILGIFLVSCKLASPQDSPQGKAISVKLPTSKTAIMEQAEDTETPAPSVTPSTTETAPPPTMTAPTPTVEPAQETYVVQDGDSLWRIAQQFGTTVTALQQANEIIDGSAIDVDQELVIPPSPTPVDTQLAIPMETAEVLAETAEPPATAAATTESDAALTLETPAVDETKTASANSVETPTATETADAPGERAVLHSQILCPAAEEIALEGDEIVGYSAVCHIPIVSYRLGNGDIPLVLVGGIHGGYEWNTILLAYDLLYYLQQNPDIIPPSLTIYLIPNANPDGLYAVSRRTGWFTAADLAEDTVPGRFNGNSVDLNRNWDCHWTPNATWRNNPISGGTAPFSEAENQALRDFILRIDPVATLFYHSAALGVFASGCDQVDPASKALAEVYSETSGYPLYDGFNYYAVTGDAGDWLASQGFPSISIELSDHESLNSHMNRNGLKALMNHIAAGAEGVNEQPSNEPPPG